MDKPYRPNPTSTGGARPNFAGGPRPWQQRGSFNNTVRGKFFRLNHNIRAHEVRVLDEEGKQVGVMATSDALKLAQAQEVDLVEIASKANPVVVKLIDFKKFQYEEAKKEREQKKKIKETVTKEIWLTPNMAEHDLNVKMERIKEFLADGDRVKLTVKFTGRQMAHTDLGFQLVKRIFETVAELGTKDREPRMEGRRLTAQLAPLKS